MGTLILLLVTSSLFSGFFLSASNNNNKYAFAQIVNPGSFGNNCPIFSITGVEPVNKGDPIRGNTTANGASPSQLMPLEHRYVKINYELVNCFPVQMSGLTVTSSWGGAQDVNLGPSATLHDSLIAQAPSAGKGVQLTLNLYGPSPPGVEFGVGPLLQQAFDHIDIAARYYVGLDSFKIRDTRSNFDDTDIVSLAAGIIDLQHPNVGVGKNHLEVPPQKGFMEEVDNGLHPLNHIQSPSDEHNNGVDLGVLGPFDFIPDNSTSLAIQYVIQNSGYAGSSAEAANAVFNTISDGADGALTAIYPGSSAGWDKLNDLTHKINKVGFVNCDGPVAVDQIEKTPTRTISDSVLGQTRNQPGHLLDGAELAKLITSPGDKHSWTISYNGKINNYGDSGTCGPSNYDVTWSILRANPEPDFLG